MDEERLRIEYGDAAIEEMITYHNCEETGADRAA